MANITIIMKDGEIKRFDHEGRAGGSYTKTLRLEKGWAIVEDEWGEETIIPEADIKEIKQTPNRGSF